MLTNSNCILSGIILVANKKYNNAGWWVKIVSTNWVFISETNLFVAKAKPDTVFTAWWDTKEIYKNVCK